MRSRTRQSRQTLLPVAVLRTCAAALFVVMTLAFLTLPYSLAAHPGEKAPQSAIAANRHLS
jgi:hypothetical protein